jgi:hypothetical protein
LTEEGFEGEGEGEGRKKQGRNRRGQRKKPSKWSSST